ncbi:MAG: rhomboid family intramembrane serine protease [Bacteroidetes bacterium]|nr:rhomboid family intramembrane serine protease [Bacteroidota bacterium]
MNRLFLTPAVKQIVIACVVLYIGTILMSSKGIIDLNAILAMHYPLNPLFKPWQIITHMFMHDTKGISPHLIFNMIALISIGTTVENVLGTKRFVKLFVFSGLGSIGLHLLIETIMVYQALGVWLPSIESLHIIEDNGTFSSNLPIYTDESFNTVVRTYYGKLLGASGAIYGIVVAFAIFFPNTELMFLFIPYPIKAKYLVPIIIGLDIYLGVSDFKWDPIAHFAHIGGAVTGLLIAWYWRKFDRRHFF